MSRPEPTISVVIPTYNRADVTARTVRHLLDQTYDPGGYEILVVDNSSDATPAMVGRIAESAAAPVRVVRTDERLPAVKRNVGTRLASGDLMLFMNDDVWVGRDFLEEHVRTHLAHGEPVAVVGHCEQSAEMPDTAFIRWYRPFAYDEIAHLADRPVAYRHFWSMNLSLPRAEMLERNLLFHEDWAEIGHEDVELGYRWSRAGREIFYNPRARGYHYHPHTLQSACRLQESIGRGLRDLEVLIPEAGLLGRYGVFSLDNGARGVFRGLARGALFNRFTVPPARRWLERQQANGALARWMYWKVLLHHTGRGYAHAPRRAPRPLPIRELELAPGAVA
ncbi:MAG: glycosyltransferase family 2 protein [Actinomycetota bacterium]